MLTLATVRSEARKIRTNVIKKMSVIDAEFDMGGPAAEDYAEQVEINAHMTKKEYLARREAICVSQEQNRFKKELLLIPNVMDTIRIVEEQTGISMLYIPQNVKQTFFITIRPDETKTDFTHFYGAILKMLKRKCFRDYTMSFEQKGTTVEDIGKGFHCHIVAHMTQASKAQVIRDLYNTIKDFTAPNCLDVKICKNPDEVIQKYLIDYEAADEHKIITKIPDEQWRTSEHLLSLYRPNDVEDVYDE